METEENSRFDIFDVKNLTVDQSIDFDIYTKKDNDYVIITEAKSTITQELYLALEKEDALYVLKKSRIDYTKNLTYYIKQYKQDHKKCIEILYESNNKLFKRFLESKENYIDINIVRSVVDSIVFLVRNEKTFMKTVMPHLVNGHELSYHSLHVAIYALSLGNILGFSDEKILKLGIAALLHDIGLKKIDPKIINKKGELTPNENKIIRKHTQYGVDMLLHNNIHDPYIIDAVMHHHERYDAQGYPNHIEKTEINDLASIIAICDVFDALTNERPYRHSYSSFEAFNIMMNEASYDASVMHKFNLKYLVLFLKLLS